MIEKLKGKKTYFVAAGVVAYAILGVLTGQMEYQRAVELALGAAGLGALRAGISKQ